MQTFKRNVVEVKTDKLSNFHRYFNHFDFKGIVQDKNVFDIDQESFYDATNMYVDDERKLVSRPTLQKDKLPDFIERYLEDSMHSGYTIVDMVNVSAGGVYVIKTPSNYYSFIFVKKDGTSSAALTLEGNITKYNISVIEQYVICFNDVDAKVIDMNEVDEGWQDFSNFVDTPVTKRVVGNSITEPENNAFTKSFKEEYIWSNSSQPILPESDNYEVKVNTESSSDEWTIPKAYLYTDYKLLRQLNIKLLDTDIISVKRDRICIARSDYFLYSLNGQTFTTAYYPVYNGRFLNIASISEDGKYFFFVAEDGVYRCDLGDFTWKKITLSNDTNLNNGESTIKYSGRQNICKFLTGDIFAFLTYEEGSNSSDPGYNASARLYWQGPGLYMGTDYTKTSLGDSTIDLDEYLGFTDLMVDDNYLTIVNGLYSTDCATNRINILVNDNNTIISALFNGQSLNNQIENTTVYETRVDLIIGGNMADYTSDTYQFHRTWVSLEDDNQFKIISGYIISSLLVQSSATTLTYKFKTMLASAGTTFNPDICGWKLYDTSFILTKDTPDPAIITYSIESQWTESEQVVFDLQKGSGAPLILSGAIIANFELWSVDGEATTQIPTYKNNEPFMRINTDESTVNNRLLTFVNGDYYYMLDNNYNLYTNNLTDEDIAIITYTYTVDDDTYKEVPDVSYSDTELYLAFGNILKITQNDRDGTKILFNLPKINDQTFIDNITGLINISTTEVALFFEDKIVICSKIQDENLDAGYRYDYYNTKLSVGIRKGDSVINTLEGSYTIFPTRRGLSVMNYQAFMATTDQVVEYITDDIKEIWTAFYDEEGVDTDDKIYKIHIMQWRNRLMLTNGHNQILIYDLTSKSWWKWQVPINIFNLFTDQLHLRSIYDTQLIFKESPNYYDFGESGNPITIDYSLMSQPLHMNGSNYYKNIKQLVFQFGTDDEEGGDKKRTLLAQIKLYRKKVTTREPEQVQFKVDELRTFVKRFNYWKINELQWALANDRETASPTKLELNGISIKYEYGEEVR